MAESKDLAKLISQGYDSHMTANDLAFFLATHVFADSILTPPQEGNPPLSKYAEWWALR